MLVVVAGFPTAGYFHKPISKLLRQVSSLVIHIFSRMSSTTLLKESCEQMAS